MPSSPFRLDNEIALITGGGTGLGLGIARAMAEAGAQVVLAGRREEVLEQAAEKVAHGATYAVYDVTRTDDAPRFVQEVESRVGPVSVLVNNAGIHLKKPALATSEEELLRVFHTHVTGAFALTRALAGGMLQREGGSVIFIASMTSLFGMPEVIAYTTAKTAVVGMVRALAVELSDRGVRVNAIAPGWIESPMLRTALDNDPPRRDRILARTPMKRFGQPDDIGHAAVYLASPAARFVTGAVLPVDGGASIGF